MTTSQYSRAQIDETAVAVRRRGRPSTGAREAILTATAELIRDSGLARLTTREIAHRAGVAESSIFYHFDDKTVLLQAVVGRHLPAIRGVGRALLEHAGKGTVRENLIAMMRHLERFYQQMLPLVGAVESDPALREHFRGAMAKGALGPQRGLRKLADYLHKEAALGRVRRDVDCNSVA